jgi:hypothetical protein
MWRVISLKDRLGRLVWRKYARDRDIEPAARVGWEIREKSFSFCEHAFSLIEVLSYFRNIDTVNFLTIFMYDFDFYYSLPPVVEVLHVSLSYQFDKYNINYTPSVSWYKVYSFLSRILTHRLKWQILIFLDVNTDSWSIWEWMKNREILVSYLF